MTPQEIRDAVQASPVLQALASEGKTQAVADALSTGFSAAHIEVEAWRAQRYFIKRGKWRAIVAAAENANHPARLAAQAAVDLASNASMRIDFADAGAETRSMWAGLIAYGLCSEQDQAEIEAWCLQPLVVTHTQVGAALQGTD